MNLYRIKKYNSKTWFCLSAICSKMSLRLSSGNLAEAAALRSGWFISSSMIVGSKQLSSEQTKNASSLATIFSVVVLKSKSWKMKNCKQKCVCGNAGKRLIIRLKLFQFWECKNQISGNQGSYSRFVDEPNLPFYILRQIRQSLNKRSSCGWIFHPRDE